MRIITRSKVRGGVEELRGNEEIFERGQNEMGFGGCQGSLVAVVVVVFCLFSSFEEFPRDIFLSGGVGASLKED